MEINFTSAFSWKKKSISIYLMRAIVIFLSLFLFSFIPNEVLSQNAKIVIKSDVTLTPDQVFNLIRQQTKYRFAYRYDMFANLPDVKLEKGTITIGNLINKTLSAGNFKYEESANNTIIIKEVPVNAGLKTAAIEIKGRVTDNNGVPLPGVNVISEMNSARTTTLVVTDFDGKYSISVPNAQTVLMFYFMGFETQKITVGNKTIIDVSLKPSVSKLDEIVLIGYGQQKSTNVTG